MYRVAKKCTKNSQGHCLKYKHHKVLRTTILDESIIECTAENRCIFTEFNANHYYCVEVRGLNDMTEYEKKELKAKFDADYEKKSYREYVLKYYPKQQALAMIKAREEGGK